MKQHPILKVENGCVMHIRNAATWFSNRYNTHARNQKEGIDVLYMPETYVSLLINITPLNSIKNVLIMKYKGKLKDCAKSK